MSVDGGVAGAVGVVVVGVVVVGEVEVVVVGAGVVEDVVEVEVCPVGVVDGVAVAAGAVLVPALAVATRARLRAGTTAKPSRRLISPATGSLHRQRAVGLAAQKLADEGVV
jgi:hypothetical protein